MSKKKATPGPDEHDDLGRDLERLETLLKRGVDEVSDIEIDEITKGLSADEIDERFGGSGSPAIKRSNYSQVRKIGGLEFEEGIQYIIENDLPDIGDIPIETIEQLPTTVPDTRIAVYKTDPGDDRGAEALLGSYNQEYLDRSGIVIRSDGTNFSFYAGRTGKIVLYKNLIYLVAADRNATCTVHLSSDRMEAQIDCFPAIGNGAKLKFSTALEALEKSSVVRGYDNQAIEKAVEAVNNNGLSVLNVTAARGQPPRDGINSEITLNFPTEFPEIGFTILSDGRIDYKKQAPIKMVSTGDLLASVSEPQPGTDGYDVTGKILPAKQGENDDVLEGENVRRGETGDRFYAECSGMVSFHERILSVYPHYQVDGDVDMHSGNINFNGSVSVLGNVKSGFEVKANGDIFIAGSTEAASIDAGRDVRVNGAIVGGNASCVKAGRNIFAGHVQNAQLEAQGDVIVVRSVMHSHIYSTGKAVFHDREGSIVGGMVNAMRGIDAWSIGSPIGTQTEAVAGSDYLVKRKKAEFHEIITFHEANLAKIDTVLKPLMEIVKKGIPLGSEKKRRLGTIIEKRFSIVKQLRLVRRHLAGLSEIDPDSINATVIVRKTLFQDVTVRIGNATLRTNDDLKGVRCRLSDDRRKIELHAIGDGFH